MEIQLQGNYCTGTGDFGAALETAELRLQIAVYTAQDSQLGGTFPPASRCVYSLMFRVD
jgi:hypothetical protein